MPVAEDFFFLFSGYGIAFSMKFLILFVRQTGINGVFFQEEESLKIPSPFSS